MIRTLSVKDDNSALCDCGLSSSKTTVKNTADPEPVPHLPEESASNVHEN